jgi:predicted RNA binding protein YcfA (HicA-like mRNA interferase family)
MKLPRDMDAAQLIKARQRVGYCVVRQSGSHTRLQCDEPAHSVAIPNHSPLRVGTFAAILGDVASKSGVTREVLLEQLFS